jgi:2-phospho-L-lactate guanylyltransferase
VVVPVKAFTDAKERLASVLGPAERATLARSLATGVVAAADPMPVVVSCDDDEVRQWALDLGHRVDWTPGLDLNGAVSATVSRVAAEGTQRVLVIHADLPFARDLDRLTDHPGVTLVPDRRGDGTNVAVVPAAAGWRFAYGPGSFARHRAEAERLGLALRVVEDRALGWDVDVSEDLTPPPDLGPSIVDRAHA